MNIEYPSGDYQDESPESPAQLDEDTARAVGGEGALELEAGAPAEGFDLLEEPDVRRIVLPPASEAERDNIRREADPTPRRARTSGLIQGPNGQLVTGGRKGRGKGSWDQH